MNEIEISISGKVQGVGFREFAKKRADELEITGYIQNIEDGSLEMIAQGNKESLEIFIEECRKGPMFATITDFKVEWHTQLQDVFTEFEIW